MVTGSPYMSKPRATTESARLQSMLSSGIDRHPSGPSWISSPRVSSGLTRCPSSPWTFQVNTRSPTPSCGAASPAPGASTIVSVRSATSVRSSLSKSTTGTAGVRSTGSPKSRIGLMGKGLLLGWRRSGQSRRVLSNLPVASVVRRVAWQGRRGTRGGATSTRRRSAARVRASRRVAERGCSASS